MHVVFWDNKNVDMVFKPSMALNQRITYSCSYASNCAKGGVFVQLCDWIGTEELWTGAVSDSKYQDMTGIIRAQRKFSKEDLVNGRHVPFHDILNKGYCISLIAWGEGRQTVCQPVFAK